MHTLKLLDPLPVKDTDFNYKIILFQSILEYMQKEKQERETLLELECFSTVFIISHYHLMKNTLI